MLVLMLDNNVAPSKRRSRYLEATGFEVVTTSGQHRVARILDARTVDVVCVDLQLGEDPGPAEGVLARYLSPKLPVVLISDDTSVPSGMKRIVDVVVDPSTLNRFGTRIIQQIGSSRGSFFKRWFEEWSSRAARVATGHAVRGG